MIENNKNSDYIEDVDNFSDTQVGLGIEEDSTSEADNTIKNTVITVNNEKYAVGLFWQPLQDVEDAINEIKETVETVSEESDLYCLRYSSTPQYALGVSGEIKAGMKVAATSVADAFSDKQSSVSVFKVEEGWWFLALRSDLILAEDDRLFTNEEDAKAAFFEMMAVPDWGRKIAPPHWNIEDTTDIKLDDIMRRSSSLKLAKIPNNKISKNMIISGAVLLFAIIGGIILMNLLSAPPPVVYKPLPQIKKVAPKPIVKQIPQGPIPWLALNSPTDILSKCYQGVMNHESITIPGWQKSEIFCTVNEKNISLTSDWVKNGGRISWFSSALNRLGLESDYQLSIAESGSNGNISSMIEGVDKIKSPPELSQKDIRLQLLDIFEAIGIPLALGAETEGEILDPNNPNARPRPQYFLVKYKFATEYSPDNWVGVLPQFQALTIENIKYNVNTKIWSYEGKVYERRN